MLKCSTTFSVARGREVYNEEVHSITIMALYDLVDTNFYDPDDTAASV